LTPQETLGGQKLASKGKRGKMTIKLENLEELEDVEEEEGEEAYMAATLEHDIIAGNICTALRIFLRDKDTGRAFGGSAEYHFLQPFAGEPGQKAGKQPDVSFVAKEKLPQRLRSYPDIVPDLVVEVSSPTDREYLIEAKVALYQKYGVKLIWVAHPYSRRVDVYRLVSQLRPQVCMNEDELNGEEVIPGFRLVISQIFDYPPDPDPIPEPRSKVRQEVSEI